MTALDDRRSAARATTVMLIGALIVTVVALVAVGLIWWVAVPVGPEACSLVLPGPRNCFIHDRLAAAIVWTVLIALACLAAIIATVLLSRRWPWVVGAGIVLLLVLSVAGLVAAAWIPALA